MFDQEEKSEQVMSPYLVGILLGLVLLASFVTLGTGLHLSDGYREITAWLSEKISPQHFAANEFFQHIQGQKMSAFLMVIIAGLAVGGFLSAWASGGISLENERGKLCGPWTRLWLAFTGGILAGFAMNFARGGLSEHFFSGIASFSTGGLIFFLSFMAGGFTAAIFTRA
jgi:hypothetical protein